MNRTRLLLIGLIALALGGFVSLLVYRELKSENASASHAGVNVVVAANNLQVGAKIEDGDVKIVTVPEAAVPPGSFHQMSQVIGRGIILPISTGEFILGNKLAGENAGYGLPSLIPPGMRAVSVRVNEVVSVAGFVQPGTRVDVLLTGSPGSGGSEQTTTVLENVAVIATGQKLERTAGGDAQMAPVITLLVSPDDAQKLTLASTQGRIQLALRNPLDTREQNLTAVNSGALYGMPAPTAPVAPRPRIVRHTTVAPPAAPQTYTVEVIRGDKKEETPLK
jgi:pilus assembly protein CpaB